MHFRRLYSRFLLASRLPVASLIATRRTLILSYSMDVLMSFLFTGLITVCSQLSSAPPDTTSMYLLRIGDVFPSSRLSASSYRILFASEYSSRLKSRGAYLLEFVVYSENFRGGFGSENVTNLSLRSSWAFSAGCGSMGTRISVRAFYSLLS